MISILAKDRGYIFIDRGAISLIMLDLSAAFWYLSLSSLEAEGEEGDTLMVSCFQVYRVVPYKKIFGVNWL